MSYWFVIVRLSYHDKRILHHIPLLYIQYTGNCNCMLTTMSGWLYACLISTEGALTRPMTMITIQPIPIPFHQPLELFALKELKRSQVAARRPTIKENRERKGGKYFEEETILLPRKEKRSFHFPKVFLLLRRMQRRKMFFWLMRRKRRMKRRKILGEGKYFFEEKKK